MTSARIAAGETMPLSVTFRPSTPDVERSYLQLLTDDITQLKSAAGQGGAAFAQTDAGTLRQTGVEPVDGSPGQHGQVLLNRPGQQMGDMLHMRAGHLGTEQQTVIFACIDA